MKPVRVSMDDGLPDVVSSSISAKGKEYWPKEDRYKWLISLFFACSLIDITRIALSLCVVEVAKDLQWNKLETVRDVRFFDVLHDNGNCQDGRDVKANTSQINVYAFHILHILYLTYMFFYIFKLVCRSKISKIRSSFN